MDSVMRGGTTADCLPQRFNRLFARIAQKFERQMNIRRQNPLNTRPTIVQFLFQQLLKAGNFSTLVLAYFNSQKRPDHACLVVFNHLRNRSSAACEERSLMVERSP